MAVIQKEFFLPAFERGFHLITSLIEQNLSDMRAINEGFLHVFIKHTSASISINENADPTVRMDMEQFFNKTVPEGETYFKHTAEGLDDMPAHIKSALIGSSITIPIFKGKLNLGIWQGIYLGEHRDYGGKRCIVLTLYS